MINYITGNILDSKAQAIVNTINTMGVMGKGIALQFKKAYPNNYKSYSLACKNKEVEVGKMFLTTDSNISSGEKIIINFPTKQNWRKPSEYIYIENGLDDLIDVIKQKQIESIAIPPLGAGNGGLKWEKVKKIIEDKLSNLDIEIFVYEPTSLIVEKLKEERVKLTDARALLLYVLYDLVKNGEYVSEFSSEKVSYFLQRFGAEKYFKLQFTPNFYGPYSGKVRYVLNALNGSYIMGYSDMNKKPFLELATIAKNTTNFLSGFYSDFALELLSSIDFIASKEKTFDKQFISNKLTEWSDRKQSMFSNPKYIEISFRHLQNAGIKN
jgi:O-acetyl-ADP-ribose deacetylase (regulator of RNase III)